jgi:hypothetical protein
MGKHGNKSLQEAYDKYQEILHDVLEYVFPEPSALLEAEQSYYDLMRGKVYLVNSGEYASSCWKGRSIPDEMRERISNTIKESGICKGENNPFFGKKHSQESLEKARASHRKYIAREETKDLMRQIHLGRKMDEGDIAKRQESRTSGGKPYSTRCNFVACDAYGVEKERFGSIAELVDAGFCKGIVYKSIRENTPYRDMFWRKDATAPSSSYRRKKIRGARTSRSANSKDLVGFDLFGNEVIRFRSLKELELAGYTDGCVYKSINTSKPYKNMLWKKESPTVKPISGG